MSLSMDPLPGVGTAYEADAESASASPTWLLGVAALSVALGLAAHMLGRLPAHFVGYALDSLIPFTLVAWYRRRSLERLVTTTLAPSSHSAWAVARPSPDVEAQTRAVRSASPRSISPSCSAGPFVGVRR